MYHESRTSLDLPHLEAWTGDCEDVVLHLADQGQLLLDVFACIPSKERIHTVRIIMKRYKADCTLANHETMSK